MDRGSAGSILPSAMAGEHHKAQELRSQAFLEELGARLRSSREKGSLSLSELARRAGISRRYLTEAEAGRANPSILVLAQLAGSLGVSLDSLTRGLTWRAPRRERFALVGLRGAGKSTVGRRLASELDALWVELDARIEELAELSLGEIFELHGAEGFHRFEREALESVLSEGDRVVIATGGSIVESPESFERLRETCRTVWLKASSEEHLERVRAQGDRRPMRNHPRAMEELEDLLQRRTPAYSRCDFTVETSGKTPGEVVAAILTLVEE